MSNYIFPVQGYGINNITSYFGSRTAPTAGASTYHQGIDIGAASGANVLAAAAGTVLKSAKNSAKGNYIQIQHPNGDISEYEHLTNAAVQVGQKVNAGQKIGTVGSTGTSTGPHLHFGIMQNGKYINPLTWGGGAMPTSLSSGQWFSLVKDYGTATPGPALTNTSTIPAPATIGFPGINLSGLGNQILDFIKKYFWYILPVMLVIGIITKKR